MCKFYILGSDERFKELLEANLEGTDHEVELVEEYPKDLINGLAHELIVVDEFEDKKVISKSPLGYGPQRKSTKGKVRRW